MFLLNMDCRAEHMPSSDPRIFGPPTWLCLHILAQHYPLVANMDDRVACVLLLFSLARMLPCRQCGQNFRKYLRTHDVVKATIGRQQLVTFLVGAHNDISLHTRPGEAPYPVSCAENQYAYRPLTNTPPAQLW